MKIPKEDIGKRSDVYVLEQLDKLGIRDISRNFIQKNWGTFLTVNKKQVKASYKIRESDTPHIDIDNLKSIYIAYSSSDELKSQKKNIDIIYEDDNCLILNKESGIVVHPGEGNKENTLANYVKGYLEEKGEFDSKICRGGIVHRLDKGVSGLILFAKNILSQKHYQKQFEEHRVQKIYLAKVNIKNKDSELITYIPEKELDISGELKLLESRNFICDDKWLKVEGYISRSKSNRIKMKFLKYKSGNAKSCLTYIKPLDKNRCLVKIESGRMHQIRATFEYLGASIIGDTLYASNSGAIPDKIDLQSIMISLHNLDGDILTVKLPYEKKRTN